MKVSVCIPVHNGARTLDETLRSIVAQTYRDMEIVVVDNASSDATPHIARRFAAADPRVRHERFESLVPVNANITRCIQLARGEYTAVFHADDVYRPDIVAKEVALLDRCPDIAAVVTRGGRIDAHGRRLSPFPIPYAFFKDGLAVFDFPAAFRATLQYAHIYLTPSAMFRTSVNKEELKEWPATRFGIAADLYVFLTIARTHRIAILNEELMDWRASEASMTFRTSRVRRTRHDMFLSLNHFMTADAALLRPADHDNYDFLVLKDDTNIAISCLIDGNSAGAKKLAPRIFSPRIIASALRYRKHGQFLAIGYATWLLAWIPLGVPGRFLLQKIRFG